MDTRAIDFVLQIEKAVQQAKYFFQCLNTENQEAYAILSHLQTQTQHLVRLVCNYVPEDPPMTSDCPT